MKPWSIALLAGLLAACGGSAWYAIAQTASPNAASPNATSPNRADDRALVRTALPRPAERSAALQLPVTAEPGESALIRTRVSGFVAQRRADIGDDVAAGAILAVIDAPELIRDRQRAQATRTEAAARLKVAEADLRRAEPLAAREFVSRATLDQRQAEADAARATLQVAEAELKRLDELLAFREVRAPFAGTVTARSVDRGDLVIGDAATTNTPLFSLAAMDRLRVVADVPQSAIQAAMPGTEVALTFDALPGETLKGQVSRSSGAIDRASGTMRVEIALDNPGRRLPSGAAGQASFAAPAARAVLLVPTSAVLVRDGASVVIAVEQGRAAFRPVTLGRNLGATVEILTGLTADEPVVLNPNGLIRPGDAVRIAPPPTPKS